MGANLETFESTVSLVTISADTYTAFFIFIVYSQYPSSSKRLYTLVPTAGKDCMSVRFLNLLVLVIASAFRNIINDTFHSQSKLVDLYFLRSRPH